MIKYLNLLLFAGMVVINYLANALPLNNKTTGELSDSFPNLFVPAGITFSIWGVIYLLLFIYCIIQFTGLNQTVIANIGWFFGITCILNALWIVFWHYGRLQASLIVMVGLLISLIDINLYIKELPFGFIKAAFGIYFLAGYVLPSLQMLQLSWLIPDGMDLVFQKKSGRLLWFRLAQLLQL